jgi:RNA polymerase sigma-70 factor (ECF subfamily)
LPTSALEEAFRVACQADRPEGDDFDYERAGPIAVRALARLPEQRRELLALAYIVGESRATLSQRFGVPIGTIKTWLHRTLETVRKDCLAATQPVATTAI